MYVSFRNLTLNGISYVSGEPIPQEELPLYLAEKLIKNKKILSQVEYDSLVEAGKIVVPYGSEEQLELNPIVLDLPGNSGPIDLGAAPEAELPGGVVYTEEGLMALPGMPQLRVIAEEFGVKDTSKVKLVEKILEAQAKASEEPAEEE